MLTIVNFTSESMHQRHIVTLILSLFRLLSLLKCYRLVAYVAFSLEFSSRSILFVASVVVVYLSHV